MLTGVAVLVISQSPLPPAALLVLCLMALGAMFYFMSRLRREGIVEVPAPDGDRAYLASRITWTLDRLGYKPLPQTEEGRWEFKLVSGLFANARVAMAYAGAHAVQVIAPSWIVDEIVKQHGGTRMVPGASVTSSASSPARSDS